MTGKAALATLLAALVVSAILAGTGAAAASWQLQLQAPVYAVQSLPEMNVTWSTLTGTITNEASWEVNAWEFGPTPTLKIYNSSGMEVETGPLEFGSMVNRNADYTFSVKVPKQFFDGLGLTVGFIGVEIIGSIGGSKVYVRAGYNYTSDRWEKESIMVRFDGTTVDTPFFFANTNKTDNENEYMVNVTGHFTDVAPQGYYYCGVKVFDSNFNEVKLSSLNWLPQNMFKSFRLIVLEKRSGFTVYFLDENGEPIRYVRNGQQFKIVINATSPITYALFAINKGGRTWIVLKFDQGKFTVGEGYKSSEKEYYIVRDYSPNFTLNLNECYSSNSNVTFVGSFSITDGEHKYTVVNVVDAYGNVLEWINKPLDPKIVVDDPYIYINVTTQQTAGRQLIEVPVKTNDEFNILVDVYGEKANQVDKVCIALLPFSLELLQGGIPEYAVLLAYNITQNQSAVIAVSLPDLTPLSECPVELVSVKNAFNGVLHLNFSLMFNTTNSTFFGSYVVFPIYLNSSSDNSVWNVDLSKHFELSSLIAFNSAFDWFEYSVGEDGSLILNDNNYYVKMRANLTVNTTASYELLVTFIGSPPGLLLISQVGYVHFTQTMLWNRTYFWTHINGTPVSSEEMQTINNTIWSDGVENPGYTGLGPLTINASIDDLINNPDYWWITSNNFTWSWLVFNVQEVYVTSISDLGLSWNTIEVSFAGMLLYVDQDGDSVLDMGISPLLGAADPEEATHVFIINSADDIELKLPFNGTYGANGSVKVPGGTTVDFGVSLTDINGTLFPLKVGNDDRVHSVWSFIREVPLYVDPSDFEKSPSPANVTSLSLTAHFHLGAGQSNYRGVLKVDQEVGDWSVATGNDAPANLTGRSLAMAYYGKFIQGNYTARFFSESGNVVDSDSNSTMSNSFSFKVGSSTIADFQMGGSTYTLNGSKTLMACSSTIPLSAFSGMYVGETGDSIANITITGETYFMATCFPEWGGEDVQNDPSYISYISTSIYESQGNLLLLLLLLMASSSKESAGVLVLVAASAAAGAAVVAVRRARKKK